MYQISEFDPQVFKELIISIILNSKSNRLKEVEVAKIADEIYKKRGSSLKELLKVHKTYIKNN